MDMSRAAFLQGGTKMRVSEVGWVLGMGLWPHFRRLGGEDWSGDRKPKQRQGRVNQDI
jgi:hypothetical protein